MVGLGLDYDIFLVTRIREYVAGGSKDDEAIDTAVERTGGIITVTGLVTAGAYGTMMLSQIPMLQQLGLAIFTVVLLDATLTRIYLVPSIMRIMKRLNWWAPSFLRRVPVRPEEELIPPIPLKIKLGVTVETFAIIGLSTAMYLDYAHNIYFQNYASQRFSTILSGINVWTGAFLALTSFLTAYFLMRGRSRRGGQPKASHFGNWAERLHTHPSSISKIAPTLPDVSASPTRTPIDLKTVASPPPATGKTEPSVTADSDKKKV